MAETRTATADSRQAEATLCVRRRIAAPQADVFHAWTTPETLKRWWAHAKGFSVQRAEIDLRRGGRYRITMRNPGGEIFAITGVYQDVRPPERLVYTWSWEGTQLDGEETLVSVDFRADGDATEIVLTHERFGTAERRDRHHGGWDGVLDSLARVAGKGGLDA